MNNICILNFINYLFDMNENNSIFSLKDEHKILFEKFITFFKNKKEKFVREIKLTFSDFKHKK